METLRLQYDYFRKGWEDRLVAEDGFAADADILAGTILTDIDDTSALDCMVVDALPEPLDGPEYNAVLESGADNAWKNGYEWASWFLRRGAGLTSLPPADAVPDGILAVLRTMHETPGPKMCLAIAAIARIAESPHGSIGVHPNGTICVGVEDSSGRDWWLWTLEEWLAGDIPVVLPAGSFSDALEAFVPGEDAEHTPSVLVK